MIVAVRWRKLIRDFDAIQGRIMMMVVAIGVGIFAVTTIATAYAILTREISRNYVATNPASALIDLDTVDQALVDEVRRDPEITAAEATSIVTARVELRPDEWVRMLLFVVSDFRNRHVGKVFPQAGAYPPPEGTILLEREALTFLGTHIGEPIRLQTPTGPKLSVTVSGTVHDPSLAPAWQEQTAYGYITPATYVALGGRPEPDTLEIVVRDALHDQARVDNVATRLATDLLARGVNIHQIQIPPTGRHPHQTQMTAVLTMFLVFAALALILSAILTASMIDGLLAQQVRQIAVMKAIGARSMQVAGVYLTGVLAIAGAAVAIGVPLGILSGRGFAEVIAALLNFDIADHDISGLLVSALVLGGLAVPVAFALVPIRAAMRRTVRDTMTDHGVKTRDFGSSRFDEFLTRIGGIDRTLILAIRNTFRRRARLVLTLALLGAAGGMFLASLSVQYAWNAFIAASALDRRYDLELRFDRSVQADALIASVASVPHVEKVEPWAVTTAAAARPDGLTLVRTYPDGGHANLDARSLAGPDSLSHLVFLEGEPRQIDVSGTVVLNQSARSQLGGQHVGDTITLTIEGRTAPYHITGVVRQILTLPTVYLAADDFAAVTRTAGETNAIRLQTTGHDAAAISWVASTVEARLQTDGIRVVQSISEAQMGGAVGGHVKILVVALVVMAALMAVVGLLGLASAQSTNVAERTREFGIMRTIGGTNSVIIRNVVAEGLFTGVLSLALAAALGLPLAAGIGHLVGMLSFGLPLPLMPSYPALAIWTAIISVGATGASLVPALNAARLTIRQTLANA